MLFYYLSPGNTFDNTRPGLVVVNGQNLILVNIECKCTSKYEEQESAPLTGCLFWTVSVPTSDCAPMGSNVGFQNILGTEVINQEVRGNLSSFNNCNIQQNLLKLLLKTHVVQIFNQMANL